MLRDLLNTFSTTQIFVMCVALSVMTAVVLALALRALIPDVEEGTFEQLSSGLRVVYELLFALILAFVIASVLDKFNDADNVVGSEATALTQLVRNDAAFPDAAQVRFGSAIATYVDAAVHDEWKTMRDGKSSPDTAAALETMYAVYRGYTPASRTQADVYSKSLDHLDEVAAARRERLAISASKLPGLLVIMLPFGALLLLVVEYRPTLGRRSQMAFMGTLALVLSSTYLLTVVLDYPFSGDISVSNAALRSDTLAQLMPGAPRAPQPGDRRVKLTASSLEGVWNSDAYGTVVLRHHGNEIRGAYRIAHGTVRGTISADGVFDGVWCEGPTRKPGRSPQTSDAGLVRWRLVDARAEGRLIVGTWSYGFARAPGGGPRRDGGWDLHRLDVDTARDLEQRLRTDPPPRYCHTPR
jgi:Protein of unknown function (DUF4239)